MASREEARQALARRLGKYKVQRPVRVCYLGDGRGYSASNMYVPGETDKVWARESQGGGKPFKLLNRTPDVKVSFNMPVLVGYPESDPDNEQILGTHWGGLVFSDNASAISGTAPHHTQHEWGGGDEVSVDPRQFLPGLIAPTNPPSMAVRLLAFQHHAYGFKRFNNSFSDDVSQYKPAGASTYRYVLFTVDPRTNEPRIRPGNVFTADLSIDSILANQGENTFRHIPSPPNDEIPMGAVLLEPDTTTLNWRIGAVNNIFPLRLLLSQPTTLLNQRVEAVESALGLDGAAQTGAGLGIDVDLLPGRIDGAITRLELNRATSFAGLPTLRVSELGYVNDNPSGLAIGTASGNKLLPIGSGGGGGASVLGQLSDVNADDLVDRRALVYDTATSAWVASSKVEVAWFQARNAESLGGEISAELSPDESSFYSATAPFILYDADTNMQFGTGWSGSWLEFNGDFAPIYARFNGQTGTLFEVDAENEVSRFFTTSASRAFGVDYNNDRIEIGQNVNFAKYGTSTIDGDSYVFFAGGHGFHIGGSAAAGVLDRLVLYELDPKESLKISARSRQGAAELFRFTKYGRHESLPVDVAYAMETLSAVDITAGSEDAEWTLHTKIAGAMGSRITVGVSETLFNGAMIDHDTKIASSSNASMFVVDSGLGAVQIGTSIAGQIADFRDYLIEFNKNQNDMDVVIRGVTTAAYYFDVSTGKLGLGTDSPAAAIDARGDSETSFHSRVHNDTQSAQFALFRSRGTESAPNAIQTGDILGAFSFRGHTGSDFTGSKGFIAVHSEENWTPTANGTSIRFSTTPIGSTTLTTRMRIVNGVQIGSPTGGDKGAGTINTAADIYKNNSAYTNPDYVLEHYYTGKIEKYKENDGAKDYPGVMPIAELDNYMREHNSLPTRPSGTMGIFERADWVQEKLEEQAIYIVQLHERIEKLERTLEGLS